MQKAKKSLTGMEFYKACGIGFTAAAIITLLMSVLGVIFISNEYFEINSVPYIALITQFLSVFFGVHLAGKIATEKREIVCGLLAAVYYLVLLATAILFFDGISGAALGGLIACLLGFGAALILQSKKKIRSGSRRRRGHSR